MHQVCILLAAYNGSKYLHQMIDSVLAQDFNNFRLVLSDDQSTDGSADILDEYAQKYPQIRVYFVKEGFTPSQNTHDCGSFVVI